MAYLDLFRFDLFQLQITPGKIVPFRLVRYDSDAGPELVGKSACVKNKLSGIMPRQPPAGLIEQEQSRFFDKSGGYQAGFASQQRTPYPSVI